MLREMPLLCLAAAGLSPSPPAQAGTFRAEAVMIMQGGVGYKSGDT